MKADHSLAAVSRACVKLTGRNAIHLRVHTTR
jgi:hypothetical protein